MHAVCFKISLRLLHGKLVAIIYLKLKTSRKILVSSSRKHVCLHEELRRRVAILVIGILQSTGYGVDKRQVVLF